MSVELYVSKIKGIHDSTIQSNIEYATRHPYPIEELKKAIAQAGENSELAAAFTEKGRSPDFINFSVEKRSKVKEQAEEYSPGLYKRLGDGNTGLRLLATNQELSAKDPKSEVNNLFLEFQKGIRKLISLKYPIVPKVLFSEETDDATFEDYIFECKINYLPGYVDGTTKELKLAFIELYKEQQSKTPESTTDPLNLPEEEEPTAEESAAEAKSPINDNEALKKDTSVPSPINKEVTKKQEPTETTDSAQSTITTKGGELNTEVSKVKEEETKSININLETNKPSTDVKSGESINSSSTANTTLNDTTNTNLTDQKVTSNAISTTVNPPSVKTENTQSVIGGAVSNLKQTAINSVASSNISSLKNDVVNSLGVSKEKVTQMAKPVINAYNAIDNAVVKAKNENNEVSTSNSAVNNSITNKNQKADNSITSQTKNTQISVDSKSPVIPKDTTLAAPEKVTNNTQQLIEKSSQKENTNSNNVTYSESTKSNSPAKQETAQSQASQTTQVSGGNSLDISELVNEMRAIKLILMGGIDVNHK